MPNKLLVNSTAEERMIGCTLAENFFSNEDVVANGGTISGTPVINRGAVLNGTTDYISYNLINGDKLASSGTSFVFDFIPNFDTDDNNESTFLGTVTNLSVISKRDNASSNALRILLAGVVIASIPEATYSPFWNVGERNVLVIAAETGSTNAWLNGNQILTNDATSWTTSSQTEMAIGARSGGSTYFDGTFNSFKMFNSLLTGQEAADYYNNENFTYEHKAIAALPLTAETYDPTNSLVKDRSGEGNDFTVTGATKLPTKGFSLDGSGDYFFLADNASMDFDQEFAIAMLFKVDTGGALKQFFHKRDGADEGLTIDMGGTGTDIRVILEDTSTNQIILTYSRDVADSQYHTLVVSRDSGDNLKLCFDGKLVESGSTTYTSTLNNSIRATIGSNSAGGSALIGAALDFLWVQGRPMTELQAADYHQKMIRQINSI